MTIREGDFIKITYTGKLEDGTVFDTTSAEMAKVHGIYEHKARYGGDIIIVGANQMIQALEEDIKLHEPGYEGTVSVPPEKGFGERDPRKIRDLPIKRFEKTPQVGMQVQINGSVGTVTKVLGRHARVDFNTIMAGQTVTYQYKIDEVIEGTKNKAVGLGILYTGRELDIEIDGTVAVIHVPIEFNYAQNWNISKGQMAREIMQYTDITEVRLVEVYSEDMLKGRNQVPVEPENKESEQTEPETGEE